MMELFVANERVQVPKALLRCNGFERLTSFIFVSWSSIRRRNSTLLLIFRLIAQ